MFLLYLFTLCIIKFSHVVICRFKSSSLIFSLLYVFHCMVHSSVAGILCCFHFGAITITVAVNIFAYVFWYYMHIIIQGIYSGVERLSQSFLVFNFSG